MDDDDEIEDSLDITTIKRASKPVILYSSAAKSIRRQHEHYLAMLRQFKKNEEERLRTLKQTKSVEFRERLKAKFDAERKKEKKFISIMKKDMDDIRQLASTGIYRGRTEWK